MFRTLTNLVIYLSCPHLERSQPSPEECQKIPQTNTADGAATPRLHLKKKKSMKPFLFSVPLMSGVDPLKVWGASATPWLLSSSARDQISTKPNFAHYGKNECQMWSIPFRLGKGNSHCHFFSSNLCIASIIKELKEWQFLPFLFFLAFQLNTNTDVTHNRSAGMCFGKMKKRDHESANVWTMVESF